MDNDSLQNVNEISIMCKCGSSIELKGNNIMIKELAQEFLNDHANCINNYTLGDSILLDGEWCKIEKLNT